MSTPLTASGSMSMRGAPLRQDPADEPAKVRPDGHRPGSDIVDVQVWAQVVAQDGEAAKHPEGEGRDPEDRIVQVAGQASIRGIRPLHISQHSCAAANAVDGILSYRPDWTPTRAPVIDAPMLAVTSFIY